MPGARPRSSPMARVAASARRGTAVPAGVLGAYRVPRVRTVTVQASDTGAAAAAWITPPLQEVSGSVIGFGLRSLGEVHPELDIAASIVEAWAGPEDDDAASQQSNHAYTGGINIPDHDGEGQAVIDEGFFGVDEETVLSAASSGYSYPPGAEVDPDDSAALVSLDIAGRVVQGSLSTDDALALNVSLRQVGIGDYDIITGPDWHDRTMIAAASVVEGGLSTTSNTDYAPFSFPVTLDAAHGTAVVRSALYLLVVDNFAIDGDVWTAEETRVVVPVSPDDAMAAPEWQATVRLPRYRPAAVGPNEWTQDGLNWWWDAGLYLPSDFASLTGFPDTFAGASELDFYILEPGVAVTDPFTTYYLAYAYDSGGGVLANDTDSSGITDPVAGSHLWVYWNHGGADPEPANPPSTYVPASLAENGTA